MRLLNFFKLLNKKTEGNFLLTVVILVIFTLNIIITMYGYGLIENNESKPYFIFLFLSSFIHSAVLMLGWGVVALLYYGFLPFISITVIPLWKEAGNQPTTTKPGGKVKF